MIQKLKKYAVKWASGETTNVPLTPEQATNLRQVEMVKSVTLIKK